MNKKHKKALDYIIFNENTIPLTGRGDGNVTVDTAKDAVKLAVFGTFGNIIEIEAPVVIITVFTKNDYQIIKRPTVLFHLTDDIYKNTYNLETENLYKKCIDVVELKNIVNNSLISILEVDNYFEVENINPADVIISFLIYSNDMDMYSETKFDIGFNRLKKWVKS